MHSPRHVLIGFAVAICLSLCSCASERHNHAGPDVLADTHWTLMSHQGAAKSTSPALAPSNKYQIALLPDGIFEMELGCNHAVGRWSATPMHIGRGSIAFRALAIQPSPCPLTAFDTKIARETMRVKVYKQHRELMQLRTDHETYIWKRQPTNQ